MGANWRTEGFHLSINRHGLASLWDSEAVARDQTSESYLFLKLLPEQVEAIEHAQKLAARKDKRHGTSSNS